MKKILLTVMAVLLTAGAMAQNAGQALGRLDASSLNSTVPVKAMPVKKLSAMKADVFKAAAKAAPQGTEKEYFLDYMDYLYNLGSAPRYHRATKVVFADNNKVYFQNMIFTSLIEGAWIEGNMSADGSTITIPNKQFLADMNGQKLYLCKMLIDGNNNVSADQNNEVTLTYDKTTEAIICKEGDILGVFNETYDGFYTFCQSLTYVPAGLFPAATEHDYSCVYEGENRQNYSGKVKMITIEDMCYINGMMPDYPEAWLTATVTDGGITLESFQTVDDDIAMAFITVSGGNIAETYTLALDNASDSYKSESGIGLVNLFATNQGGMGYDILHSDINLKKSGTTGINNAVTGDEGKEVVSSELFDLSGRRVSDTQKGVVIKVTKYADGSSNTTKIIK